ncbi:MAG: FAD-binding protein [Candidatus Moranbacteria bacterium]|nr:FAD-binding protein [Candidatus Moranbacteria bacterium]
MDIKENISLAPYTTLKIGGEARFFCEAKDGKEISEALKFARKKKMPVFVLGGGSNVLVSDNGFNGIVIKISNSAWKLNFHDGSLASIECGSGVQLSKIVNESAKAGLTGLEWAAGIPGTVGGALRGNAGAFGGEMAEAVESINVMEIQNPVTNKSSNFSFPDYSSGNSSKSNFELQVTNYQLQECKFSYRDSIFKQNPNLIILSANLRLEKGRKEESEKKVREIITARKEAQPFDFPSSGSFFKNPTVKNKKLIEEYEKETGNKAKDGIIPAGYLIDMLNLRGKKIGGAMVSQAHGNFLVNAGGATAEDMVILVSLIKQKARNKFGVQLREEVQMVGF